MNMNQNILINLQASNKVKLDLVKKLESKEKKPSGDNTGPKMKVKSQPTEEQKQRKIQKVATLRQKRTGTFLKLNRGVTEFLVANSLQKDDVAFGIASLSSSHRKSTNINASRKLSNVELKGSDNDRSKSFIHKTFDQ